MDSLFTFSQILFTFVGFIAAAQVVLVHLLSGLDFKDQKKADSNSKNMQKRDVWIKKTIA